MRPKNTAPPTPADPSLPPLVMRCKQPRYTSATTELAPLLNGGYGIFYSPDYRGISNQLGQQPPFGGNATCYARNGYCVTFNGQTAIGAPYTRLGYIAGTDATSPLPAPGFPNFDPQNRPQGIGGLAVNRNDKHSRMQEYNLQLQQQFGKRDVFSIAYAGSHCERRSTYYRYNQYNFGSPSLPLRISAASPTTPIREYPGQRPAGTL